MAASRRNPNVYWVHNDSGHGNKIYAINDRAELLATYTLDGFWGRDWEDIAVGPGPEDGVNYIYVGNIGDNAAVYDEKFIGRIPEPYVDANQSPVSATLYGTDTITLRLPDQRRDTETLMIDPWTKDLYIVSKRENNNLLYRLPYPQSTSETITAELLATLDVGWIVGGDISPSGTQILLKYSSTMWYWCREPGQSVADALTAPPQTVPYVQEQQGESVCWRADEQGYLTISEGSDEHLFFYQQLVDSPPPPPPPPDDTVDPEVAIDAPVENGVYQPPTPIITVVGTATDNVSVEMVTYALTGATGATGMCETASTYLVSKGAVWKFLDDGSNQGAGWRNISFGDSAWQSGPAPLGYGDDDEATVVGYGPDPDNRYMTTYFRRSFTISSSAPYTGPLDLYVARDDGVVVYLNGTEIYRSNMPSSPIDYLTPALSTVQGADEEAFNHAVIDGGLLVSGENVIAVELHQAYPGSHDLGFDLELSYGSGGTTWCIPEINLKPGTTTLKVTARDPSGNKETKELDIVYTEVDPADIRIQKIPGGFKLTWVSEEGVEYTVMRATDLGGCFSTLVDNYPSDGVMTTFVDYNPPPASAYYRILEEE